jgi:hypothetical protein
MDDRDHPKTHLVIIAIMLALGAACAFAGVYLLFGRPL